MLIGGILDMSTVDYPGKVSSVIFTCGCSFRCPFCHNYKLVLPEYFENCKEMGPEEILNKIKGWKDFIDAVVFTGGEPCLQKPEELVKILKGIKSLGLGAKFDTNGFHPECVKKILPYVDYFAIDIKAKLNPKNYGKISGKPELGEKIIKNLMESLKIIKKSGKILEARTTVILGLNDSKEEIKEIVEKIKDYADIYSLQEFRSEGGTLDPKFKDIKSLPKNHLLNLGKIAKSLGIKKVYVRTISEEKIIT